VNWIPCDQDRVIVYHYCVRRPKDGIECASNASPSQLRGASSQPYRVPIATTALRPGNSALPNTTPHVASARLLYLHLHLRLASCKYHITSPAWCSGVPPFAPPARASCPTPTSTPAFGQQARPRRLAASLHLAFQRRQRRPHLLQRCRLRCHAHKRKWSRSRPGPLHVQLLDVQLSRWRPPQSLQTPVAHPTERHRGTLVCEQARTSRSRLWSAPRMTITC
jgi:hypothetical protein